MCEISMRPECESADWVNQKLCHIWLNRLPENWSDFRGNSGFFLEYRIDKDEDIRIIDNEKNEVSVQAGETILLPAATQEVTIVPEGAVKLLETYV